MPDVDEILDSLRDDVVDLAETHFEDLREQAIRDSHAFLEETEEDMKRWSRLLQKGDLSKDEFRALLRGRKDLAEMEALKQAGLTAARADSFRDALVDEVVETVASLLL